ncbi:hypothetical protein SAY86_028410 [Trapa natans]|uniref:Cyclin-like domain-containing protein n=1 Tax=Trapa natans TaxID=22666 RepID=A0AAN7R8L2_TRANT|nr:hypothetical protein SAY86_028410 [Trapa natans]
MAPVSPDCVLLCGEDASSVFDDDSEWRGSVPPQQDVNPGSLYLPRHHDRLEDEWAFPVLSEDCLRELLEKERQLLPGYDYLKMLINGDVDVVARTKAIDWIHKVHSHYNFGPLCAFLAVNYLDRFISAYELPKGNTWSAQLLAVACLSLAVKMEETEVPPSLDLQSTKVAESRFVFDAKVVQRMELLVLSTLNWRMQAVSPLSFIDYFFWRITGNNIPTKALISRSIQVLLSTLRGIQWLEFRPSEVAAATTVSVAAEAQLVQPHEAISALIQHVDKERVIKCMKTIHNLAVIDESANNGTGSMSSVLQSPTEVLEATCFSYISLQVDTLEMSIEEDGHIVLSRNEIFTG